MKYAFYVTNAICVFLLGVNAYHDALKSSNSASVRIIGEFLSTYKLVIASACLIYVFVYTVWPKILKPCKEKRVFLKDLLTRLNQHLFADVAPDCHRITLFKEIGWVEAILRNYLYLIYHFFCYRPKWRFYLRFPKYGRYLKVYSRCGLDFKRSSTMFHVERNSKQNCQGVAEYIRFIEKSSLIQNLPNISDLDLTNAKSVQGLRKADQRRVKQYMEEGKIRDFLLLKKIHRRARHFYGTIIKDNETVWGVLLVDSMGENSPFDENVRNVVDTFALVIGRAIQMEV